MSSLISNACSIQRLAPLRRSFVLTHVAALIAVTLSCTALPSFAQHKSAVNTLTPLPVGITLPVQINHSLQAGRTSVGTSIVATTTQRVFVGPDIYLNPGARLLGKVESSVAGNDGKPSVITIRFDTLQYRGQSIPIVTRTIAIANFTEVEDTAIPANGSTDRGNSNPASWTTQQVGGDEVYRSGWQGDVCNPVMKKVGFADYYGVYQSPLHATPESQPIPHAMGVFSTSANGLYGFDQDSTLQSAAGEFTVQSPDKKLILRNGDNLLLQVLSPHPAAPPPPPSVQYNSPLQPCA